MTIFETNRNHFCAKETKDEKTYRKVRRRILSFLTAKNGYGAVINLVIR